LTDSLTRFTALHNWWQSRGLVGWAVFYVPANTV